MSNKPRVLFVARRFPPSVGGMERFAFDLFTSLKTETHQIDKVTWGGSNKWLPLVVPGLFLGALWKIITRRDYDILHIQDALLSPIGWLLHRLSGRPCVIIAHGLDITYKNRLYQAVVPWFLRRADAIISISAATGEEVVARGVLNERSHVIPLGITDDTEAVEAGKEDIAAIIGKKITSENQVLLTVGRLVKRKGVQWFIREVFPTLAQTYDQAIYVVAGEGAERPAIERAIEATKLQGRVFLLGEIEEELKLKLYKACNVFVMPNIKVPGDMEGFGRVAHEAAVAGMPVVASNLEGIADALMDGKNGVLVPTRDTKAYVREISKLLDSSALRRQFGKDAREYTLQEFGWGGVAERYASIYRKIV